MPSAGIEAELPVYGSLSEHVSVPFGSGFTTKPRTDHSGGGRFSVTVCASVLTMWVDTAAEITSLALKSTVHGWLAGAIVPPKVSCGCPAVAVTFPTRIWRRV